MNTHGITFGACLVDWVQPILIFATFPTPIPTPTHPWRKHHHSLLPYSREFKSSGNIPMGLLTINHGVSDSWDHARAMVWPCWDHVWPGFISTLAREVKFSRLSKRHVHGVSIFQHYPRTIFRPCLQNIYCSLAKATESTLCKGLSIENPIFRTMPGSY